MKKNRDILHLLHIRDAIERIELYAKTLTFSQFEKAELEFDAIMMQIIVIGEAVNSLSDEFKGSHPKMPWYQAVGLRNQTAHGYFDINPKIVWETIKEDLPVLKIQLKKILAALKDKEQV